MLVPLIALAACQSDPPRLGAARDTFAKGMCAPVSPPPEAHLLSPAPRVPLPLSPSRLPNRLPELPPSPQANLPSASPTVSYAADVSADSRLAVSFVNELETYTSNEPPEGRLARLSPMISVELRATLNRDAEFDYQERRRLNGSASVGVHVVSATEDGSQRIVQVRGLQSRHSNDKRGTQAFLVEVMVDVVRESGRDVVSGYAGGARGPC